MKRRHLLLLWGGMFILCAIGGFIRQRTNSGQGFFTLLALLFFVPPGVLLYRAKKQSDAPMRLLIRNLAALSLGLTAALLIVNFLSVLWSETLGAILNSILTVVSSPMVCSGYWAVSIFGWAFLLVAALKK